MYSVLWHCYKKLYIVRCYRHMIASHSQKTRILWKLLVSLRRKYTILSATLLVSICPCLAIFYPHITHQVIPSSRNFKFVRVCSLVGRYFYNMYILKKLEIVFFFNVEDNSILPCLHNIRLSFNKLHIEMLQCFVNQNAHV